MTDYKAQIKPGSMAENYYDTLTASEIINWIANYRTNDSNLSARVLALRAKIQDLEEAAERKPAEKVSDEMLEVLKGVTTIVSIHFSHTQDRLGIYRQFYVKALEFIAKAEGKENE